MNQEKRMTELIERLKSETKVKELNVKQIKSIIKDGNTITTKEGETVDIRVYSDGWTKLTGSNIFEQFESQKAAYIFLKPDLV